MPMFCRLVPLSCAAGVVLGDGTFNRMLQAASGLLQCFTGCYKVSQGAVGFYRLSLAVAGCHCLLQAVTGWHSLPWTRRCMRVEGAGVGREEGRAEGRMSGRIFTNKFVNFRPQGALGGSPTCRVQYFYPKPLVVALLGVSRF